MDAELIILTNKSVNYDVTNVDINVIHFNLKRLPLVISSKILLYLQCPISKIIKEEIEYYETDHNWDYTKMYKRYYIKNIFDFSTYYFDQFADPTAYNNYLLRQVVLKEYYYDDNQDDNQDDE